MGSGEGVGHKSPKGLPWWSSVRTSLSNAWGADSVPGQKLRSHMPGAKQPKQNRSNTVTNSIKTFKMVHIKKKKKDFPGDSGMPSGLLMWNVTPSFHF